MQAGGEDGAGHTHIAGNESAHCQGTAAQTLGHRAAGVQNGNCKSQGGQGGLFARGKSNRRRPGVEETERGMSRIAVGLHRDDLVAESVECRIERHGRDGTGGSEPGFQKLQEELCTSMRRE